MNHTREYLVSWQNLEGMVIKAKLAQITRYVAVVEIYSPDLVFRVSQTLADLKIGTEALPLYSGRGIIASVIHVGSMLVCEIKLVDEGFQRGILLHEDVNGVVAGGFEQFLDQWQQVYRIATGYKIVVGDMFSFLDDLRYWLTQVELGFGKKGLGDLERQEADIVERVARKVIPIIDEFFAQFEAVVEGLPLESRAFHGGYMRRQLHPLILCAPFAHRTYTKPLGYAGDYEMINMIARNGYEGSSLYAKVVNRWFIEQPPAVAHRNRLTYLAERVVAESLRGIRESRPVRILNLACGPAWEVQALLSQPDQIANTRFTLLDFNEETLQYTQGVLGGIQKRHPGNIQISYVKKSVHQLIKEAGQGREYDRRDQYDFVYCAGLFDYLSDQVCHRLLNLMYDWTAPGGLVIATNVEPSNPLRHGMDHLLEWHLNYRRAMDFRALAPKASRADDVRVFSDQTGVNIFLEVRKPHGA